MTCLILDREVQGSWVSLVIILSVCFHFDLSDTLDFVGQYFWQPYDLRGQIRSPKYRKSSCTIFRQKKIEYLIN